jgi:RHS repeat-associated protein
MLALATSFPAATGGSPLNQVGLVYDNYSQLGEDRQEHSGAVDGGTKKVAYGYFDGSANTVRRRRVRYPSVTSGWSYNYLYGAGADDALSRVTAVRNENGSTRLVSYRYLGLSAVVGVEYEQANSTELTYEAGGTGDAGDKYTGLDRFGRLVETVWKASSAEKLHSSYGRNRFGGAVWRRDDLAHAQGTPVETEDHYYWYDGMYRVEQHQRGDLAGTAPDYTGIVAGTRQQDEDFLYDATGNWLSYARQSPANSQAREHNTANEITEIETVVGGSPATIGLDPGGYDAAGNMLELPADPAAGTALYGLTWDAWNRLVKAEDGAATLGEYAYDALHRRVKLEAAGDTRHFYYDDRWRPVEEYLDTGFGPALEREYCWGLRDRWDLARRRRDTGTSIDDEERYVLRDYLDPYATVDGNGAVKIRLAYDAFGRHRVMDSAWSPAANSDDWTWLYHGEFLDAATGLYNYGFRYYSPNLGRWASRDPIGEGGGLNLYGFVRNDGVNRWDFLGTIGSINYSGGFGVQPGQWPGPARPYNPPDTSDGLSYPEGAKHFFGGPTDPTDPDRRTDLDVPFDAVDQGWDVKFFLEDPCLKGGGTHPIDETKTVDLNSLGTFFTIAGPGQVDVKLTGSLTVLYGCGYGCWYLEGRITTEDDEFNFHPRQKGARPWIKEMQTKAINKLQDPLGGKDFRIRFPGGRDVDEEGCCVGY